jgi:ribosomal protein S18 acetylase RimI-like enzyme
MRKTYAPGPHLYLQTIGIRPEAQGQGLASRLIRPFLAEADRRGLPCYTETVTPENVGLYEHYGFRVVEMRHLPGLGLTLWGFYRPKE